MTLALIAGAVAAGAVAGAGTFARPAFADESGAPPTGTYTLDTTSIWAAQNVVLTQTALSDDGTPADAVQRTVAWGDGSTEILPSDATTIVHAYPRTGSYPVAVTLRDADGNEGPGTVTGASTVDVAATPGTYTVDRTLGWTWKDSGTGETGRAKVTLKLSGVPTTVTRVWVSWGDGETSLLNRTTTRTQHWAPVGSNKIVVTPENGHGKAAGKPAGTFVVKADSWNPTAKLTIPKSPTKASSWKSVKGTVKDNQSGAYGTWVVLFKVNIKTDKLYYFKWSTKKWVRLSWDALVPQAGYKLAKADAKGAWKVSTAGITKGYRLEVQYSAEDQVGNQASYKSKVQKITK